MLSTVLQYLEEKHCCPHCSGDLTLCHSPSVHVGDGLGWGSEYLFICLNDSCPLFVKARCGEAVSSLWMKDRTARVPGAPPAGGRYEPAAEHTEGSGPCAGMRQRSAERGNRDGREPGFRVRSHDSAEAHCLPLHGTFPALAA